MSTSHMQDALSPPKSKATTANPKDLFGNVKVNFALVSPIGYAWEAFAMMDGAEKYGPFNWRDKPVIASVYVAAGIRHFLDYWEGQNYAADSQGHHLGHAKACAGILLDAEHRGVLIDDRPAHDDDFADALDEMSDILRQRANWKREGAACFDIGLPGCPYDAKINLAAQICWQRGWDMRKKEAEA